MTDQVKYLNQERKHFQINEPDAPCNGRSTCTDCVCCMIVAHETGKTVSAMTFRMLAAPAKDRCRGLNPSEALRGLYNLGVRGYQIVVNPTASQAITATDKGIVLVAVGYNGFPTNEECEVGGKTDDAFEGPHAISLWGRRNWHGKPVDWPAGKVFKPGWRVWTRDPDHHWGAPTPPYDRFNSTYLVRAMDALVGNEGWQVRLMIAKGGRPTVPKAMLEIDAGHSDDGLTDMYADEEFPDFGMGQSGGPA